MIEDLHDFILVKPMITESPVFYTEGVSVPELEKLLVDQDSDKEYASLDDAFIQKEFQRAFELYPVNTSRLLRYAGRKGKKEEIQSRIGRIDQGRIDIIRYIQSYFLKAPVEKAWLFGSFSRMEENADSDIDILVNLDRSVPLGLLDLARMTNSLERLLKRKVDLVEESSVKPFASENINKDKVLVYERA
jgi:predicted nucleotidyltransferase